MKIAVATDNGMVSPHFGHCEAFVVFTVSPGSRTVVSRERLVSPPHAPGLIPQWLRSLGIATVLTGGMGPRAQALFAEAGIDVICGVPPLPPEEAAERYLNGTLVVGRNACDH